MSEIGRCQNDGVDSEVMSVVQKRLTVTAGLIARAIAGQGDSSLENSKRAKVSLTFGKI